jgi:hypothetical protein
MSVINKCKQRIGKICAPKENFLGRKVLAPSIIAFSALLQIGGSQATQYVDIRGSHDGNGVSHIFWLQSNKDESDPRNNGELVGVIDPLYSAIRIYLVKNENGEFSSRVKSFGACALPPPDGSEKGIRPWRIIQLKDSVVIESSPEAKPEKNGQNSRLTEKVAAKNLISKRYEIKRYSLDKSKLVETLTNLESSDNNSKQNPWFPGDKKNLQCGNSELGPSSPATSAPYYVSSTDKAKTFEIKNRVNIKLYKELLGQEEKESTHALKFNGVFQSVLPLEPSNGYKNFILTYTGNSQGGIIRTNRQIISISDDKKTEKRRYIHPNLLKSKMGYQVVSVLPTGEILMIGKNFDSEKFQIIGCGFVGDGKEAPSVCSPNNTDPFIETTFDSEAEQANQSLIVPIGSSINSKLIFSHTKNARDGHWAFDAGKIPNECRSAKGCYVVGEESNYIPPAGQRLTKGKYEKFGLPYSQGSRKTTGEFFNTEEDEFNNSVSNIMNDGEAIAPGNLDDHFPNDAGIDCSSLAGLALLNREQSLRTDGIQAGGQALCPSRLAFEEIKPGDLINIMLLSDRGKKLVNHVVIFAQFIRMNGANLYYQVLESSSSCDGVCWSFYDSYFFSGWGIYRARNRSDFQCSHKSSADIVRVPFPSNYKTWSCTLLGRCPGN